jgi:hypothetical protein
MPNRPSKPTGTREHGNTGTREHGNTGTREHGNTGTREHGNTGTREHGNTGTREVNFKLSHPSSVENFKPKTKALDVIR